MMVPVGRLVLFPSVEKAQLIATMAYLQVPAQIGPLLGPPIGGFITTYFSWRWIFLVNVPLGLLGIVLVTRFFDNPKAETRRPLDWSGFVLTGTALFCIMYGIEAIGRGRSEFEMVLLVLGVVLGGLALRHLLRNPGFSAAAAAADRVRLVGVRLREHYIRECRRLDVDEGHDTPHHQMLRLP
jgi:MFS family permease